MVTAEQCSACSYDFRARSRRRRRILGWAFARVRGGTKRLQLPDSERRKVTLDLFQVTGGLYQASLRLRWQRWPCRDQCPLYIWDTLSRQVAEWQTNGEWWRGGALSLFGPKGYPVNDRRQMRSLKASCVICFSPALIEQSPPRAPYNARVILRRGSSCRVKLHKADNTVYFRQTEVVCNAEQPFTDKEYALRKKNKRKESCWVRVVFKTWLHLVSLICPM